MINLLQSQTLSWIQTNIHVFYGLATAFIFDVVLMLTLHSHRSRRLRIIQILLFTLLSPAVLYTVFKARQSGRLLPMLDANDLLYYGYAVFCWFWGISQVVLALLLRRGLSPSAVRLAPVAAAKWAPTPGDATAVPGAVAGSDSRPGWLRRHRTALLLFGISLAVSLGWFLLIQSANERFLYFYDEYGIIYNIYFHSDIARCIYKAFLIDAPHKIHPFYNLFYLPLTALGWLNRQVPDLLMVLWYGYALCVIQSILNALATVLVYRILRQLWVSRPLAFGGALLQVVSFPTIMMAFMPETHGPTMVFVLLTLYLFQRGSRYLYLGAIAAFGMNPITVAVSGPLIIWQLISRYRRSMTAFFRRHLLTLLAFALMAGLVLVLMFNTFWHYVLDYMTGLTQITHNIASSVAFVYQPLLLGPAYASIYPYVVQTGAISAWQLALLALVLLAVGAGVWQGWRQPVILATTSMLLAIFVLHSVLGFILYCGTLFAPLYGWPVIILLTFGLHRLQARLQARLQQPGQNDPNRPDNTSKADDPNRPDHPGNQHSQVRPLAARAGGLVLAGLIGIVLVYNALWVGDFRATLARQNYVDVSFADFRQQPRDVVLGDYTIHIKPQPQGSIQDAHTGTVLVPQVNCYRISKEPQTIVGLLDNGSAYRLYYQNGQICYENLGRTVVLEALTRNPEP